MGSTQQYDAVVVGSGPNGLVAAVELAAAGRSVLVLEADETLGGGCRSAELTEPGFVHDICSAIHAFGVFSPAFAGLPLERHGLRWRYPEIDLAHPLDGGRAAFTQRSVRATAAELASPAYRRLVGPQVDNFRELSPALLGPLARLPRHPVALARFGIPALLPATTLGRSLGSEAAAALFAGAAAHSILPLSHALTSSFGLVLLASAHAVGWPVAEGGSQAIADALVSYLRELGGECRTNHRVTSMHDLPPAKAVLFDLAPSQVEAIAGDRLADRYRRRLTRFRHGPGAFKVDYTLDGPVPWTAEACRRAGTVHLGGTMAEIAAAEAEVAAGRHPERPYVLVAQQSVVDPTRAPEGKHTLWAYCHTPARSTVDMTGAIEDQIERFAPGFRDLVRTRHTISPAGFEAHDAAFVGGDIAGGAHDGLQLLARPFPRRDPYTTSDPSLLLCSASTPPGAGVHGMCGYHAAHRALAGVLR